MVRKELITIIRAILLVIAFYLLFSIIGVVSKYTDYHTRMHSLPIWGIVRDYRPARYGYDVVIEYTVEGSSYTLYTQSLATGHLMDSVIVYYDTTCPKRAFVPMRSPKNPHSAFYLSDKRLVQRRWEEAYDKYQRQLELDRQAHRERKHFYDCWCKDD